jgi:uncharacterized membrane protein YsdA (DUF1294 family)/cold shock CspA family protein
MHTYQGIIKTWKHDKGFGFIEADASEKDVFIHIRDIKHPGYQPKIGDNVCFKMMADKEGKIRAYDAYIDGQPVTRSVNPKRISRNKNAGSFWSGLIFLYAIIALMPFVFSGWLIVEQRNIVPFFIYLVMSLVTFLAYARDKTKAIKNEWRTKESTLHLLELLGGWPGALITQKIIRHKNKKSSFQVAFWMITSIHLAFWIDFIFFNSILLKLFTE